MANELMRDESHVPGDAAVTMFERLALDPSVNVDKMERLIEMQERIMRYNAKSAFDAAYSKMSPEIPQIDEKGRVIVKDKLRSTYARLEDIQEVVKPIMSQFGFAVRHRTEWPADRPNIIRIVGILSHEQGHSEESCFEAPMDRSEYRSDIQSMGSTVSYGRRYTTLDLLNISTRGLDDDGKHGQSKTDKQKPAGIDEVMDNLSAAADNGPKPVAEVWNAAKPEQRDWLSANKRMWLDEQRAKAKAVRS